MPMHATQQDRQFDLVIIGGGINGAGIARDAAGRGLKVLLCEQHDLASATSSASSKLIHGGLRYLEYYEFRLVREALREREVLLRIAPHLVSPLRFRLPHEPHLRPAWMIRAGLFLYDTLAHRETLPGSRSLKLNGQSPLLPEFNRAFEYSDCWVDDARLVVSNAMCARNHGAEILTYARCESAKRTESGWEVHLDQKGEKHIVHAKALINATGPWVARFVKENLQAKPEYGIRMIKGSHIVVPRLHSGQEAYILQNVDKRIVFVIPWLDKWSMIGTTDVEYQGEPTDVGISAEETDYLLRITNKYFRTRVTDKDIVHSFSGVRPLCNDESNDPSAITRDYTLTVSDTTERYPLLNIFGGKLTTYRKLAESALEQLRHWFPDMPETWTATSSLPGGNMNTRETFTKNLTQQYPWLPADIATRYASCYGSLTDRILDGCSSLEDMGIDFGNGLYQTEVDYLVDHEWGRSSDDILWRRTKTGLQLAEENKLQLEQYLLSKESKKSQENCKHAL